MYNYQFLGINVISNNKVNVIHGIKINVVSNNKVNVINDIKINVVTNHKVDVINDIKMLPINIMSLQRWKELARKKKKVEQYYED